jgi:hypothetical protein
MNRIHLALFGMQNRDFGSYLTIMNRILISVMIAEGRQGGGGSSLWISAFVAWAYLARHLAACVMMPEEQGALHLSRGCPPVQNQP